MFLLFEDGSFGTGLALEVIQERSVCWALLTLFGLSVVVLEFWTGFAFFFIMIPVVRKITRDADLSIVEGSFFGTDTVFGVFIVCVGLTTETFVGLADSGFNVENCFLRTGFTDSVLSKNGSVFRTEFTSFGFSVVSLEFGAFFTGFGVMIPVIG